MKINIYKLKEDLSFGDLRDFVYNNTLKDKQDDETKDLVFRSGFKINEAGIGDDRLTSFKIRIMKKSLPASVKKTIMCNDVVKECQKDLQKKEFKIFIDDLLLKKTKMMPWGTDDSHVVIYNGFIYLIDGSKEAQSIVAEKFADKPYEMNFTFSSGILDGIEKAEEGYVLSVVHGSHKFVDVSERDVTVKGNLKEEDPIMCVRHASFLAQDAKYGTLGFTLKGNCITMSKKELFSGIEKDESMTMEDVLESAFERFEKLVFKPLLENGAVKGRKSDGSEEEV